MLVPVSAGTVFALSLVNKKLQKMLMICLLASIDGDKKSLLITKNGKYHVRNMPKDVFGLANYQEKAIQGIL